MAVKLLHFDVGGPAKPLGGNTFLYGKTLCGKEVVDRREHRLPWNGVVSWTKRPLFIKLWNSTCERRHFETISFIEGAQCPKCKELLVLQDLANMEL